MNLDTLDALEVVNERLGLFDFCIMLEPYNRGYSLWKIERGKGYAGFNRYRRVKNINRIPRPVRMILRSYSVRRWNAAR